MSDTTVRTIGSEVAERIGSVISKVVKTVKETFDDQPEEYKEHIREAEAFYAESVKEQKSYLKIWYKNIAYYMGLQWLEWNESMNWLSEPAAPSWRVRLVINLIMPTIRTEAAKILRSNPNFRVVPNNDSKEAEDGAKIGDRVLEAKYYEDDFQRKLYNLVIWFLTCGSSFLWSLWDGTAGKSWSDAIKDPATGLPKIGPDGQPVRQTFYEGEVIPDVSGPFETLQEAGAPEDFNEHTKIMRVKIRKVEYLKEKYGKDVPSEDIGGETLFQSRVSSLITGQTIAPHSTAVKMKDSAIFKEYFELPSRKYPEGRHFAYASGVMLVEPEPLDYYKNGKKALPCGRFDHITIPGRSWGMSIIEQIAPLNITYNKMCSQVIENSNLLSRPKVLAPQGSLDEDQFTSEPGEVVEYMPVGGLIPTAWKPPEMPQYFFMMKDSIPGMIDTVSGIYDVSRGKLPRRATSGKAIDLLQEADETRMALTMKNMASSLERVMSIHLCTIARKYRETRLIKKIGPSHTFEIFKFKGADLRDADTVRVEIGVALSRAAKTQLAMEMAKMGMIPKEVMKKILELGSLNLAFDMDAEQSQYADFENYGMAKGIMYPPGEHEPHDAHIEAHKKFVNGTIGQKLPLDVRQIISEHIKGHEMLKQTKLSLGGPLPPGGSPAAMTPGGAGGAL